MLLRKDAESHFRFVIKTYIPTQKYVFGWANILEIRENFASTKKHKKNARHQKVPKSTKKYKKQSI